MKKVWFGISALAFMSLAWAEPKEAKMDKAIFALKAKLQASYTALAGILGITGEGETSPDDGPEG